MIQLQPISHYTIQISEKKDGSFAGEKDSLTYLQKLHPNLKLGYFHHQHQAKRKIFSKKKIDKRQKKFSAVGDAALTNSPNLGLVMLVADCFPVVLADPKRKILALIHAGWKPLLQNVLELTLLDLKLQFKTKPESLTAWIGPGIRSCCYQFQDKPLQADLPSWKHAVSQQDEIWKIDLALFIRSELARLSINSKKILDDGRCTYCEQQVFYSHRRSLEQADEPGRILIAITPSP